MLVKVKGLPKPKSPAYIAKLKAQAHAHDRRKADLETAVRIWCEWRDTNAALPFMLWVSYQKLDGSKP